MNKLYALQQKVWHTVWTYWLVIGICFVGVVYGFYWYKFQLAQTALQFWIFTPDCPGAVFLFLVWAGLEALKWPSETFRVVAVTALIKYGIWTVSVIGLFWIDNGLMYEEYPVFFWENLMLFLSHWGMLILGITFAAKMKVTLRGFLITSSWLILNDFIDYYYQVFPWLPDYNRLAEIRMGTFILTGLLISWMFYMYLKSKDVVKENKQSQDSWKKQGS